MFFKSLFIIAVPQEIPPNHQYDIPDVPGFDESMQVNDYDIPIELSRVAFQNSFQSSQAHLTPVLERHSRPEDHYTEMSSLGYSSSYVGDTEDTPYYQVPRNAINVYNSPREDGDLGSEYDMPTALHDHPQPVSIIDEFRKKLILISTANQFCF